MKKEKEEKEPIKVAPYTLLQQCSTVFYKPVQFTAAPSSRVTPAEAIGNDGPSLHQSDFLCQRYGAGL